MPSWCFGTIVVRGTRAAAAADSLARRRPRAHLIKHAKTSLSRSPRSRVPGWGGVQQGRRRPRIRCRPFVLLRHVVCVCIPRHQHFEIERATGTAASVMPTANDSGTGAGILGTGAGILCRLHESTGDWCE